MRQFVAIAVLLAPMAGCVAGHEQSASFRPVPQAAAQQDACSGVTSEDIATYQSGAEFEFVDAGHLGCKVYERGMVEGIRYQIVHDGSKAGAFRSLDEPSYPGARDTSWAVSCSTDAMTDDRSCTIKRGDFFLFWQNGKYFLSLLGDQYPRSDIVFRVDSNQPLSAREDVMLSGSKAQSLIDQMHAGSVLRTRYTSWPRGIHKDSTYSTSGFPEALEYMNSIR